jgi:hypothetical protein
VLPLLTAMRSGDIFPLPSTFQVKNMNIIKSFFVVCLSALAVFGLEYLSKMTPKKMRFVSAIGWKIILVNINGFHLNQLGG